MVTAGKSHTVKLTDKDGDNETGLTVTRLEDTGELMYAWEFTPVFTPDTPAGVSFGQSRSNSEPDWSQQDWSGGAFEFYYQAERPNKYALADGVWALTPFELSLGPACRDVTFGVINGAAQLKSTSEWGVTGVTLSAVTTDPFTCEHHLEGTGWGTGDYISIPLIHAAQPEARWQSATIMARARVRGAAAGGNMRLQIVDDVAGTSSGTAVALGLAYDTITVTHTVNVATTSLVLRVEMSDDGGSDRTVRVDAVQCMPGSLTDGIAMNPNNIRMKVMSDGLVALSKYAVWLFDEINDYWTLQKFFTNAITGAEVFDDRLFVAFGSGTDYQYSDTSDLTIWTTIGSSARAIRFHKGLDNDGNWAMARNTTEKDISFNATPTDGATWGTAIDVGRDDHKITQLYTFEGDLAVGKEDGFYQYFPLEGNRFQNLYAGAEAMIDTENFNRGIEYNGLFYTTLGEVGLVRWNTFTLRWDSLSHLIQSPAFTELGNRTRAFGTDGERLYVIVKDLTSGGLTESGWLLALKEFADGTWAVHTITKLVLSDSLDMMIFKSSGGTNRYLYINGEIRGDEAYTYRFALPDQIDTPRLAVNKDMVLTGDLITSWMDWNRPQIRKSINQFLLISEDLSGSLTVTVSYQFDNETSFTNINSSDSIFNISPEETITFNEGLSARRVRLRYRLATTSSATTPVIKATDLKTNWREDRLKEWTLTASLDTNTLGRQGVSNNMPTKNLISRITTLRDEKSPLFFYDIDGTSHRAHIVNLREHQVNVNASNVPRYRRAVTMVLREAY